MLISGIAALVLSLICAIIGFLFFQAGKDKEEIRERALDNPIEESTLVDFCRASVLFGIAYLLSTIGAILIVIAYNLET